MLYHADFHIEYPAAMSQKDFFSIWAREAEAALGAKKAGLVIDIWKSVGAQRVVAVVNVDSLDTLDQILLDLPIMKEHGQHVHLGKAARSAAGSAQFSQASRGRRYACSV